MEHGKRSSDDIARDAKKKDQEMYDQQQLAEKKRDPLKGYDKTDADSFPASDPPSHAPEKDEKDR
ncbi:MAG TPA: hypothetical protein VGN11_00275 [Candidatus Baltobacteraceae bacterium]|jgi:hypothetical protein|nr:hypothetical protein [Candidatus Baltobacteraceae bacterium]